MDGKTGVVRLSLATGVPIVPVASWGSQAVWQKSGRGSLKFGRPVLIKAGAPIDFTDRAVEAGDYRAVRELTARVMHELTVLVKDLRGRYPRRWEDFAG
jgi:1-acyl-sn-glycerol-3-phosphate acyltransferase